MNEKKTFKTILTYYGLEFDHYTQSNNAVYRAFFVDEHFIFYEFYINETVYIPLFLSHCTNGSLLNVTWKFYGHNGKKIILDASLEEEGVKQNEK